MLSGPFRIATGPIRHFSSRLCYDRATVGTGRDLRLRASSTAPRTVPIVRTKRLVGLLGALLLAGCGETASEPPVSGADGLIEAPACREAVPAAATAPAADPAAVTVQIAPTALVQVDHRGRVVAAWTNTGCAPSLGDDVYIEGPDGRIRPARAAALVTHPWIGDFTQPGVFASQTPER